MPNNQALQVFYGTLPLIGAIVLAIWNNNKRLDEMSKRLDEMSAGLNKRLDDLRSFVDTNLQDIKQRLSDLERGSRLLRS